jgi:hypothetical protein
MTPYVIRQRDFLAKLAHKFGFDADTVWNDPANADLRQARTDPNVLWPTDMLYIPEEQPPVMQELTLGTTNTFVSDVPTATISVKFVGAEPGTYAGRAYTIQELDGLIGLVTDGDGVATFPTPVTLPVATVVFTDSGETWPLSIGGLDPVETRSGVFQRLRNLGYIRPDLEIEDCEAELLRSALQYFKAGQTAGDTEDQESGPDSAAGAGPTDLNVWTSGRPSMPGYPSDPAASDSADGAPPEVAAAPTTDAGGAEGDDAEGSDGDAACLEDDGTPDAETADLLRKAHGC